MEAFYEYYEFDGANFFTMVLKPEKEGKFPVVITRSPYVSALKDKPEEEILEGFKNGGKSWAENGYVLVSQHCRGQGKSSGAFVPYVHEREDGLARALAFGYIIEIFCLLNRKDIRHSGDSERLPENILALQQYLDAHYTEINSVSEVAEHFFYSREYVSRLFKKYYDTTILDYIHKLRISKSRALIAEGMPIIDVCYAVGFSSLSTFIRTFRTATDMTPSEYRKMVRDS